MKKLFTLILAILCLLTMLSIPALAADAGIEPYGDVYKRQVDAYSKLEAHKDEYLYFRSDHHWTALGAYYAYTAFCESAGLKAEPLSKFESGEYTGFLGSLYSAIKAYPQSQALADNPDTVQFWRPFVDLDTKWYPDAEFSICLLYTSAWRC